MFDFIFAAHSANEWALVGWSPPAFRSFHADSRRTAQVSCNLSHQHTRQSCTANPPPPPTTTLPSLPVHPNQHAARRPRHHVVDGRWPSPPRRDAGVLGDRRRAVTRRRSQAQRLHAHRPDHELRAARRGGALRQPSGAAGRAGRRLSVAAGRPGRGAAGRASGRGLGRDGGQR